MKTTNATTNEITSTNEITKTNEITTTISTKFQPKGDPNLPTPNLPVAAKPVQGKPASDQAKSKPLQREPVMRKINLIVVHCSATRSNINFTPEALENCHRQRGFKGCGYHFYITKDGLVHAMRPVHLMGAHARGYNANSIGICYEGGLDPQGKPCDTRTEKQKSILRSLIGRLRVEFGITKVVGHRDLSPDKNGDGVITPDEWLKQCPCFDVKSEHYI